MNRNQSNDFGSPKDVARVSHWRAPRAVRVKSPVRDTLEFARLAAKRWRYYRRSIPTATSIAQFQAIIREDAHAEVSFLILAEASWFGSSSALGLAQCRRTYCHHLFGVSRCPSPHSGRVPPTVQGVGSGLLYSLAELAGTCVCGYLGRSHRVFSAVLR